MSMNFDTYSTSFQSLMSPMYNIQANYNANLYGNGGAGIGNGIYGGGYGFGNGAYGYMGGFMGPMMNVGIGQFNADYLLKGEDQKNNYYARPIPVHKKENETGTILGILGTALGTAALIAALLKGKRVKAPKTGHTPAAPAPTAPAPAPTVPTPAPATAPTIAQSGNLPTVAPKYINRHTGVTDADKIKQQIMYGLNHPVQANTSNVATTTNNLPVLVGNNGANNSSILSPDIITDKKGNVLNRFFGENGTPSYRAISSNDNAVKGLLENKQRNLLLEAANNNGTGLVKAEAASNAQNYKQIVDKYIQDQTKNNFTLPQQRYLNAPESSRIAGCLPAGTHTAQTSRQAQAIAKQQAALNLPSSGQVYTMGTPELANVNNNMMNIRPDLMRNGEIVYTTHTPETLSNGYSIGSNAKGGDKLAQLLQQMQG